MNKETKYNWFIIFLIAFLVSEAIYKILLWEGYRHIRVAAVVKFLAQCYIGYMIIVKRKSLIKEILLLVLLFVSFLIGQFALKNNINFYKNFEYFNNSIFTILVLMFFKAVKLSNKQKEKALKYMEVVILINYILAIIGYVFSIKYFKTYFGGRFGYDGLLMKSSYSSYLNIVALFYGFHKFFVLKKMKFYFILIVVIGAILSGTKSSLLALFLIVTYILYVKKVYKNYLFLGVVASILFLAIYFNQNILLFLQKNLEVFGPIIEEHGYLTAILSYRDIILMSELMPYVTENWSVVNYLFGGMGKILIKSGLEIIDLFYFFGLVGSIIYLYFFKNVFFPEKKSKEVIYFCVIIVIISSFGGNFFYNSSLAIFLCGIKFYFESYNDN